MRNTKTRPGTTDHDRLEDLQKKLEASALDATARIAIAREEAARQTHALLRPQLAAAQTAAKAADADRAAALEAKTAAEAQMIALKDAQEKAVAERAQEIRSALERTNRDALNAAEAKHFEESQKFKTQLAEMTRQLENQTAQELGEGAEVDLFESLKAAYPGDEITRVAKGTPGADTRHKVMLTAGCAA